MLLNGFLVPRSQCGSRGIAHVPARDEPRWPQHCRVGVRGFRQRPYDVGAAQARPRDPSLAESRYGSDLDGPHGRWQSEPLHDAS